MKTMRLFTLIVALWQAPLFAHEETQLGQLVGENLGLFYTDHAISGHVKGQLVFATPFENEFGIKLINRMGGKDFSSDFKKNGNSFSGRIIGQNAKGEKSDTPVVITKAKDGVIEGTLGADVFSVKISSKTMEGHHYVNPEFHVQLPKAHYMFKLDNGNACMGCATKIVYVVLGMLRATETL